MGDPLRSSLDFDLLGPLPAPRTTTVLEASAGTGKTFALAGLVTAGAGFLYTTSKFAVVGMSESLHVELARHRIGLPFCTTSEKYPKS